MRSATPITYLLTFMQILAILSIPGCAFLVAPRYLMGGNIEKIFIDQNRYPSVTGDRVFPLRGDAPDSRLPKNPLLCNHYEYFNGRANISCIYLEGNSAFVANIDQDGCKLIHGSSHSPDCKPEITTISVDNIPSERLLAKQVKDEEILRKLINLVSLLIVTFSVGSPFLLPIFRWFQWRSCKD